MTPRHGRDILNTGPDLSSEDETSVIQQVFFAAHVHPAVFCAQFTINELIGRVPDLAKVGMALAHDFSGRDPYIHDRRVFLAHVLEIHGLSDLPLPPLLPVLTEGIDQAAMNGALVEWTRTLWQLVYARTFALSLGR